MRISLHILYEKLKNHFPDISYINPSKNSYLGVEIFQKDTRPIPNHILLGYSSDFNGNFINNCGLIVIGSPHHLVYANNSCVCVPESVGLFELFSKIQNIFMKFNLWDEKLTNFVLSSVSLVEMCNICIPIFENPIFIHDTNSAVLASVNEMQGQFEWTIDPETGKKSLPIDIMNDFKVSPVYQKTMNTKGAQMFPSHQFGYRILYINLWFEDSYLGRICVNEIGREITEGDYELLEYFAKLILTAMKHGNMLLSDVSRDLDHSLTELIDSKTTNEIILINRLSAFGWNVNDRYFCVSIFMQERDYSTYAIDYNCKRLENMFPLFCTFLYQNKILIVVNDSISPAYKDDFFSKLAVFLREGLFKASVSSVGQDFRHFWYYYIQTSVAFKIGLREKPMFWLYKFNDYILPYVLEMATIDLQPSMLCEPHLLALLEHDQKNKTDFYSTLRIYLENERNITQTTKVLFVHRSTLLYRLKKIESLIKVDLNKASVRFHLLLSYELLDMNNTHSTY